MRGAWRRLRGHFWASLVFDVAVLAALFLGVHAWQTRDLPVDEPAPATVLALLGSGELASATTPGEAGVVYFFAPWCGVCRHSIDNLDALRRDGAVAWASAVALDYGSPAEVREFVAETGIDLPVLMGDAGTARDWSIGAFPTYYVIDGEGRIVSRSVGYSTALGMRWRAWRARR